MAKTKNTIRLGAVKMDKLKNKILLIIILRWIARIWSISSIAFISFMVIGHIVGEESGTFNSLHEEVQFLFFPSGVFINNFYILNSNIFKLIFNIFV